MPIDPVTGQLIGGAIAAGTAAAASAAPWALGEFSRKRSRTQQRQNLIKQIARGDVEPEVAAQIVQGYSPTYLARKLADYEHSKGTKKRQKKPEYQTFYEILRNEQRRRAGLPAEPDTGLAVLAQAHGRELPPQLGGGTPEQQQGAGYTQQGGGFGGGGPGGYGPRRMGGEGNAFSGYGSLVEQFPIFTQEQQGIMNRLLPQAASGIESLNQGFAPLEEKARRVYLEKTIPSIAERFTQQGGRASSGFRNALTDSAKSFETDIGELGSRYNLARQGLLQNLLGSLLTPSYESFYSPPQPGMAHGLAAGLSPALGQGLGAAGSQFGDWLSRISQRGSPGGSDVDGGGAAGALSSQQLYQQALPRLSQDQQSRLGQQFPGLGAGAAGGFQPYQGQLTQPGSYQPGQPYSAISPQQSLLNAPITSASFAGQPYQPQGLGPTGLTQSAPQTPQSLAGRMRQLNVGPNFRPRAL